MRRATCSTGLLALLFAAPVPAQELPKVTDEGKKALASLLRICEKAAALGLRRDPRTGADLIVVADQKKLREVVKEQRRQLTPALRDSLVHLRQHPGAMALLLAIGEETGDRRATAFATFFLARLVEQAGNLPLARQGCAGAAQLFASLKMPEWEAVALGNLGAVRKVEGNPAGARKPLERSLALLRQAHGEQHPLVAAALANLAAVCHDQGDLSQARKLSEQARDLLVKLHGPAHATVATALNNLADVCRSEGDLPRAQRLHEGALALRRKLFGERHADVGQSLNNLAAVCYLRGDPARARQLYEQALALFTRLHGEEHATVAAVLNNLGLVCQDQGDLFQAHTAYSRARTVLTRLRGPDHAEVAAVLSNLAEVCRARADLVQARRLHEQALAIRRKRLGRRHPDVAASLNNLAEVCRDEGDLDRARQLHEQVLALQRELHAERHADVATSLNNLAEIHHAASNLRAARRLHEQALNLRKGLFGERHPDVAASLGNLAVLCQEAGDLDGAVRRATEAVLACRLPRSRRTELAELRMEDLAIRANTVVGLHALGDLLHASANGGKTANARQAAHAYTLAATLLDHLRADVPGTEQGKLTRGAAHTLLVPARVRLAATLFGLSGSAGDLHGAFAAVEQGRGRVFLETLARARSSRVGGVPDNLLEMERDLRDRIRGMETRIGRESVRPLAQREADLLPRLYDDLQAERDKLARLAGRLRKEYPRYAALQHPQPCTLEEARACLADNEVAVLFGVGRKESSAVVVQKRPAPGDRGQGIAVVRLPGSDVLAPKLRTLADEEVLKSDSRCRQLGTELHALLLKPLSKHIRNKNLVLAPDDVLWELPFELLVEGRGKDEEGKYLIEGRQIRYTPSMTALHLLGQWEKARKAPPEPLWALGDPVFGKNDTRARGDLHEKTRALLERYTARRQGGPSWPRLPATGAEVRAIGDLFGASKEVVTGVRAREKVLKTALDDGVLARKRYLHLATHGILGSGRGLPPSLILSLVGNDGTEQLGGANDGFLTMAEVTYLKLNADLVVLSACQTARGELVPSEGFLGLTRSFLYAGSRGVVCSLWRVDDERTAAFMKAMYGRLKEGKSSAQALALARRQLIAEEQAPFYWAPFILIGK